MNPTAQVSGLTKAYGDAKAVDSISFTVPHGGVVGLIGPNGCGKTTTMKMMLGLVRPSDGDVRILGAAPGDPGWSDSLKRVGSMIEDPPIYQRMTARENLRYQSLAVTGRVNDSEIDQLLKLVDLAERADEQPKAYSLGMKQRLGIAITLIGSPDMVILDEPANGLDPAGIREIRKLLLRLPETGTTVLVSSHQLAEVQQACEQLVILSRGKVIAAGSTQDILDARTSKTLRVTVQPNEIGAATEMLLAASCLVHMESDGSLAVEPGAGLSGRDVNRILSRSEIFASSISRQQISLEQAFLQMTEPELESPQIPVLATAGAAQ